MPKGNGNPRNTKTSKTKRPWVARTGGQDSTPPNQETRTCDRCGRVGHLRDFCMSKFDVKKVVITFPIGAKALERKASYQNQTHPNPKKKHKPNGNHRANGNGPAMQATMLGGAYVGERDVAALLLAANIAAKTQAEMRAEASGSVAARVRFAANTK